MHRLTARMLWTGGELLPDAAVSIDAGGLIQRIETEPGRSSSAYPFLMPAFFDAHCHFFWMVLKSISLDLSGVSSADEMLQLVEETSARPFSGITRGDSFDESTWENGTLPSLEALDNAAGDRPVFLCRVCGHAALANTAMLNLLNDDQGWIDRSTGMVREKPVLEFSRRFPPDPHDVMKGVNQVVENIYAAGVTGICSIENPEFAVRLLELDRELNTAVVLNGVEPDSDLFKGGRFSMIKYFLDGSFGAGNAAVGMDSRGNLLHTDEELLKNLIACGENGVQPVVHAIGRGALKQLARVSRMAFDELGREFPIRVEHGEEFGFLPEDLWSSSSHIFSMQPNFVERWQRPGGMYDSLMGADSAALLNPFRKIRSRGFKLGFGSDSMPLNPLYGLRGAVHHRDPGQSLTIEESLRAYTMDAASISGVTGLSGPLEPGRQADLVAMSGNPMEGLEGISVSATFRKGRLVFSS